MPPTEMLDVVDLLDRPLRRASLGRCLEMGLLHRAVATVVFRPDGRLLLQRRSKKDRWHPGRWTLASTGHVRAGESYEHAARRELREEMGLRSGIALLEKMLLPKMRGHGLTEWEHVALFVSESDEEPSIDPVELEDARDFTIPEVRALLRGHMLTPDAKILLRRYLESIPGRPWSRRALRRRPPPGRATR